MTSLDSTAQTGHGDDWQEEVFQKIKSMKDMSLGELNDMHQKITAKLEQPEFIQWSEQLEKLKIFKAMMERIIAFLSVSSKENITLFHKEKWVSFEKQIVNFVTSNRPRNPAQQGQLPLASLDSTAQTGHGDDWQEEVFQKIKSMKDMYLGELNDMHQKITARLERPDSIQWSEKLEKLKIFKAMLERIIAFLSVSSKENITLFHKEKWVFFEKQIVNFVTSNRPRNPARQGQLPVPHMRAIPQPESQVSQLEQSVNMHESMQTLQHNLSNLQLNSWTSLPGDSSAQQIPNERNHRKILANFKQSLQWIADPKPFSTPLPAVDAAEVAAFPQLHPSLILLDPNWMSRGKAGSSQPKLDLVAAVVGRLTQFFHLFLPLFPPSGSLKLGLDVDGFDSAIESEAKPKPFQSSETNLPSSIRSVLPGAGRGKPLKQPDPAAQVKEENRHLRVRQQPSRSGPAADPSPAQPKLSQEEAVKKAMGILSRGGDGENASGMVRARAEGGRGRGRGKGRGRGRGERRMVVDGSNVKYSEEANDPYASGEADEKKLIQELGRENVNSIFNGFLDASSRVMHSPLDDAYLDAFHTNCLIECEPEYLMGDFGTNPDIDDKLPIPLCDALEKEKPFLMADEGIQSQEEWEEAVKEAMERVPLWEKVIDQYCGPDRITAKKQQEELERIAKIIPNKAPASVKQFANRAVLSLQSNPGWGFDKKSQFMDKLAREVSQQYG
ncbi:hypothetical protein SLE2022_221820 [Rubroshorea leprosula]